MVIAPKSTLSEEQLQTLGFKDCEDVEVLTTVFSEESPFSVVLTDYYGNHHIFVRQDSDGILSYMKPVEEMFIN